MTGRQLRSQNDAIDPQRTFVDGLLGLRVYVTFYAKPEPKKLDQLNKRGMWAKRSVPISAYLKFFPNSAFISELVRATLRCVTGNEYKAR